MTKMNPEVKAQWVAALRSGEYKQGKKVLRRGSNFCCLGVLCNLHAQAHPQLAASESDPAMYLGAINILPDEVMGWAGLPFAQGADVVIHNRLRALTVHNDNGKTFAQIADAIEAQL